MQTEQPFSVVTIPLNRPEIIDFLIPPRQNPIGQTVQILHQRPTVETEDSWVHLLKKKPDLESLIYRDDPHGYIIESTSDRLIPVEYLENDATFLTRNLGGWSPVYFAVMKTNLEQWSADPLLSHAVIQKNYGKQIQYFGADTKLIEQRLKQETKLNSVQDVAKAIIHLFDWRHSFNFEDSISEMTAFADAIYEALISENYSRIPRIFLIDELMGHMMRIELKRRQAHANGDIQTEQHITQWQQHKKADTGIFLILKGEYIMGRGRCSAVLIAPEAGFVAKQPGPEPFHEAKLGAIHYKGKPENWPELTKDGALVTSAGRLRLIIEEGLIERLNLIFHHPVELISLLGFIIEPFVTGPTLQEYVLEDHSRLTPEVYEFIFLHQQVCESLGVENGDWHAANFIVVEDKPNPFFKELPAMIHIDWGAARPLEKHEYTEEAVLSRMNQVQNIAFSYQNEDIAAISKKLHQQLMNSPERLQNVRKKAESLIK